MYNTMNNLVADFAVAVAVVAVAVAVAVAVEVIIGLSFQ